MRKGVNRVALRLFEHNEKAYHTAVRMMEQYGKVTIVHPTGTGKSYIAFKLIEDSPEKVVIWLSPSVYIFKTRRENLKKKALFSLKASAYKNCSTSDAPVDSHIASEMTLGETVVRGVLSTRNYAKYQMQGDNLRSTGVQEAKCYFDAHGDLNVPADYVSPGGYNLGNWVKRQRYTRQNPEKSCAVLTEERIAKLDAIGMRWEKADSKPRRLDLALESKRKSENLNASANHKTGEDIGLCS